MAGLCKSKFINYDLISYFHSLVKQIPRGKVTTYGELAKALGDIRAARACGYMLSIVKDHDLLPTFRVIRSDGSIGKFSHVSGVQGKIQRLKGEGINVIKGKVDDFSLHLFNDFETEYPLREMQREQMEISKFVNLEDDYDPSVVGAVDVSYDDQKGYASMVIYENGEYTDKSFHGEVRFPYIPGYLSYREHFFIESLAKGFNGLLLIDGNGILHPRKIGLASFSGVLLSLPTIGVAKSLLLGKAENGWIKYSGEKLGFMLNKKTIISPGHRISLESSVKEIKRLSDERYPEILKLVDKKTVALRNGKIG